MSHTINRLHKKFIDVEKNMIKMEAMVYEINIKANYYVETPIFSHAIIPGCTKGASMEKRNVQI